MTGDNGITDSGADHADNGKPNESTGSGEQNGGGEQEKTVINQQTENGNDNGEPAQSPGTVADTEQATDNNQVNQDGLNDEQEQRESDNSNNSDNSGNDSESEKEIADLQAIIDNPESSEEDKQAALELLNEVKSKE